MSEGAETSQEGLERDGGVFLWDAKDAEEEGRFKRIVEDRVKHSPFYALIGMEVVGLAPGEARLRVGAEPHHCDETGEVHPGVVFALADAASGVAMATQVPHGSRRVVTVEMKANFLSPAGQGELTATGKVLQASEDIAISEAEVRDEAGRLLATSMATFMIIR
jgi:uncharacterized protein (TIGR00369 family)